MRILFDGFWWHSGPLANRAVQRDLITAWAAHFPEDELWVAVRSRPAGADSPPGTVVTTRLWPHAISNFVELPRIARMVGAEVVVAHNFTPLAGPALTFVHDVMFVEHPSWFSFAERAYFGAMLPSARRATAVATSSLTEQERIRRLLPTVKVQAVGLAVPSSLAQAVPTRPEGVRVGEFGLCVGRLNARKNLAAAIRAAVASAALGPQRPLLIVGDAQYSGRSALLPADLEQSRQDGTLCFLGRVSDAELAWLYANAGVVVTLSLDEGFGLPALEAVEFGAPLLASDIPVYREVVAGYAEFVEPLADPAELGASLDRAWNHRPEPAATRSVLERYTWAAAVTRLRELILDTTGA